MSASSAAIPSGGPHIGMEAYGGGREAAACRASRPAQPLPPWTNRGHFYCGMTLGEKTVDGKNSAVILRKLLLGCNRYAAYFPNDNGHVSPRRGPACIGSVAQTASHHRAAAWGVSQGGYPTLFRKVGSDGAPS